MACPLRLLRMPCIFDDLCAKRAGSFWIPGQKRTPCHSRLADHLQLQRISTAWLNKTVKGDWCKGIDLKTGSARHRPERVTPTVLDEIEKVSEHQVDGILGQGFFRCFIVELDYPSQVLRLRHPRRFHCDENPVPVTFVDFRPVIDATIEVAATPPAHGSFFVDTGAESELELADNFLQRHGFEKWAATAIPTETVMPHGRVRSRSAYGLNLQVELFRLRHLLSSLEESWDWGTRKSVTG